jgi:acetyltransferase-like isoleucine patch superfamily enzyme
MKAKDFFTFSESLPFASFFSGDLFPWEWVGNIRPALDSFDFTACPKLKLPVGLFVGENVYISPDCKLPPYGVIEGPAYIGPRCELRPGVYIRQYVIVGADCVLGNSCEFKNALILDHAQVPHFNYVGDSVLGLGAHLGAGAICANLRLDKQPITVVGANGVHFQTSMRKLGALMADYAEAGCNSVLQPGAILGKRSVVVNTHFSGYLPENTLFHESRKQRGIPRRDSLGQKD